MKKIEVDKCLVLNLESHIERKVYIENILKDLEIEYDIFIGIDGRIVDFDNLPHDLKLMDRKITRGRIGCYCSHYSMWKQIVENGWKKTLILEDDCFVDTIIDDSIDEINEFNDYDILYLSFYDYGLSYIKTEVDSYKYIFNYSSSQTKGPHNFNSYIITLDCAKKLVDNLKNIYESIDTVIFDVGVNHKIIYPMLFRQDRTHGWISTTCEWR